MDISNFCSIKRGEKRPFCIQPWNHKGLTIATDSRIVAATPEIQGYQNGKDYRIADSAFDLLKECESVPYQNFNIELKPAGNQCGMCCGFGKMNFEECPECDGSGVVSFDTARHVYEFTCKECDGYGEYIYPCQDGKSTCPQCHGLGFEHESIEVFNGLYAYHYLKKISELPGVLIGALATYKNRLYFKADNGLHGVLMGMSREG